MTRANKYQRTIAALRAENQRLQGEVAVAYKALHADRYFALSGRTKL